MSIENNILCRTVITGCLFLDKNTAAETAEKLFVSYIKICNSTTNSKTLKKIKFLLQEIHQILKIRCWYSLSVESQTYTPNLYELFFNILHPVRCHTQPEYTHTTQKLMQNIVKWAFKKGLAVTLVYIRSWVVGSNVTESCTARWVHCLVHANGTLIQAKHYTLCLFAKLPLQHQPAPEDMLNIKN